MSKNSRTYQNFQRAGGRCEPTAEIFPNGLVRADRKRASSFRRSLTVTAGGICQYAVKRTIIVNLGGTAEVVLQTFVPLWDESLFCFNRNRYPKSE